MGSRGCYNGCRVGWMKCGAGLVVAGGQVIQVGIVVECVVRIHAKLRALSQVGILKTDRKSGIESLGTGCP